jgi:hypothetical protein
MFVCVLVVWSFESAMAYVYVCSIHPSVCHSIPAHNAYTAHELLVLFPRDTHTHTHT